MSITLYRVLCYFILLTPMHIFASNNVILLTPPSAGKFYFETAHELFKLAQVNATIEINTYPNIYKKMNSITPKSKEIFATVKALNENNEKKFYNISKFLNVDNSFYTLKRSKKSCKNIEDAKKLDTICVWLDSVLNKYLITQGFENLIPVPTFNQCTQMLYDGKVDAMYSSEVNIIKSVKTLGLKIQDLKKGYTPIKVTFFLAVTKNAPKDLVDKLIEASKKLKSSKKIDELISKHKSDLFIPE